MLLWNFKKKLKMDQSFEKQRINRSHGISSGTSSKMSAMKVYGLAAIEFLIASDAVVAAIRLGAGQMSNWFIFPLVPASFLPAASATYTIAYHGLRKAFHLRESRSTTMGTTGS